MLTLLTIVGLIILAVIFFVLGVGLFIGIGVFVLIALVIAAISFLFGGFQWNSLSQTTTSATNTSSNDEALGIISQFNDCLLGEDLDPCRRKFTHWDEKDKDIIKQLAKQLKDDLGKREDNHQVIKIERMTKNDHSTVEIDQETDFAKKKAVKEHYVLESDLKDKVLKIKDLNWDY